MNFAQFYIKIAHVSDKTRAILGQINLYRNSTTY